MKKFPLSLCVSHVDANCVYMSVNDKPFELPFVFYKLDKNGKPAGVLIAVSARLADILGKMPYESLKAVLKPHFKAGILIQTRTELRRPQCFAKQRPAASLASLAS